MSWRGWVTGCEGGENMLDIVITHYTEPWEICRKQFWMLAMQRGVDWREIRVTVVNDGGNRLPGWRLGNLGFPVNEIDIEHGGISAARNAGMDATEEPWIMFCDCDDCFANIYGLQDVMNVLHQDDGRYDVLWNRFYEEHPQEILLVPDHKVFVFTHGKVYRRAFLDREQIRFDESLKWNEDSCFNATILTRGAKAGEMKTHAPVYAWIRREDSFTGTDDRNDKSAFFQFRRNLLIAEEHRKHKPEDYAGMVTRVVWDTFFMIHSLRCSPSCKQQILAEFVPWAVDRTDLIGRVDGETMRKIREISRIELSEPGEKINDEPGNVLAWVTWEIGAYVSEHMEEHGEQ